MEQEEQKLNSLPDNAYRELKPGEVYKPIMPANSKPREVTTYSVVFGIIMAIVFSAAAAYLGLKVCRRVAHDEQKRRFAGAFRA